MTPAGAATSSSHHSSGASGSPLWLPSTSLPGLNCRRCDVPTCLTFAVELARREGQRGAGPAAPWPSVCG